MRIVLMAVLVAVSTPAFATENNGNAPDVRATADQHGTQAGKAEDQAEKKICKRIDATESRLGAKKVCLTQQQWKERDEENSSF